MMFNITETNLKSGFRMEPRSNCTLAACAGGIFTFGGFQVSYTHKMVLNNCDIYTKCIHTVFAIVYKNNNRETLNQSKQKVVLANWILRPQITKDNYAFDIFEFPHITRISFTR